MAKAIKVLLVRDDGTQKEYTNFILNTMEDWGEGKGASIHRYLGFDCRDFLVPVMITKAAIYISQLKERFLPEGIDLAELSGADIKLSDN